MVVVWVVCFGVVFQIVDVVQGQFVDILVCVEVGLVEWFVGKDVEVFVYFVGCCGEVDGVLWLWDYQQWLLWVGEGFL